MAGGACAVCFLAQIWTGQAAAAGRRWAISLTHQHLFFHPFARGRVKAGSGKYPAKQASGEWETKVLLENKNAWSAKPAPRSARCLASCGSRSHLTVTAQTITAG
jgi:hypothetical protein